ncbi:hypothetical protein ACS0TY_018605 [Phlomoides rotata]
MEKTMSIEEVLPRGFLDRVKYRGLVVSGWAPQANILLHPSTGAFISHCGWSSLNESVYYGVPVIGMLMKLSMFIDAKMLVDVGACVEVVIDENGVYNGDEIGKVINEVIAGERVRRRAKELSEKMRMEEEIAMGETAGVCGKFVARMRAKTSEECCFCVSGSHLNNLGALNLFSRFCT